MKYYFIFILSVLFYCSPITNPPQECSSCIRGHVLSANGSPVPGALIEFGFVYMNSSGLPKAQDSISMITDTTKSIWATRWNSDDTIAVINNMPWNLIDKDGMLVRNDVYNIHTLIGSNPMQEYLTIANIEYDTCRNLSGLESYAISDITGYFSIPQEQVYFGFDFSVTDSLGYLIGNYKVSRMLTIYALSAGHVPCRADSVFIYEIDGAEVVLQFSE